MAFNSLYEILNIGWNTEDVIDIFTFNSLYEIHSFAASTRQRISISCLSILSMRFAMSAGKRNPELNRVFQFSL